MRLALKLCLGLGALVAGTLSVFVWLGNRTLLADAARRQDEGLGRAWSEAALECGRGGPGSRDCWAAVRAAAAAAEPAAFADAAAVDAGGSIALHSDFFKGSAELRGRRLEPSRLPGLRRYSFPLERDGRPEGRLEAAYREAALRESLSWVRDWADRRQRLALLLGSAAAVLAAVLSAAALLRPLGRLAEAAGRVAAGDFTGRVPENSSDELALVSREFNRMTDRLAELDELKAGFVTRVTHDLRAPLSGILGQADMLLGGYKGKLSGQQEESLRSMLRSGKELAELIDNIIDVTRLEAGALKLEPGPIDVEEAIGSALETHQARAAQLRVTVSSHRQPELELVRADPQALRRVLDNLLSNALKFTPAGGAVSLSARRDNHREAVFSVSDTGPGVPEHRLGDLFKKFSQVPETAKRSRGHPGSGLGLAICRELVEAQGGRIWAESRPGEGARFSFTLPLEAGG